MELNLEKNTITLYGKSYKYDLLLKKLASLPGEDIYQFISNRGIALPRRMNCMAMISALNERIQYLHSKSLTKEEFASLEHFKDFGETKLSDLFNLIQDEESFYLYIYNLMNLIMINHDGLSLNDGEVQYLKTLKKSGTENFLDYENYISACSLEEEGTFDGVEMETLKESLRLSGTVDDVKKLGEKYGIEIPEHLTRDQYYEYIVYYLKKKDKYTEETDNDLANMTLAGLTTFSRRNGIPLNPTLNKEDYITYLFYFLDGCDIVTTSLEELKATPEYEAKAYKFDLSQIGVFGDEEAKRIVQFEGDDDPRYVEAITDIIDAYNRSLKEEEEAEAEEAHSEPEEEKLFVPLRPGEKTMDDDDGNIELEEFEIELAQNDPEPEPEPEAEDTPEELEMPIELEEVKEEPKPEPVVEKIDITNVIKNEEFASKKLKNLKNGNRNVIILTVVICFIALVLGFVTYALIR